MCRVAREEQVGREARTNDGPEHGRGRSSASAPRSNSGGSVLRPCSPVWRRSRPRPWLPTRACSSRDAESDWLELAGSGTFAVDPETNARFGALVTEAHGAIERFDQAQAERRAAEERRASLRAAKHELCERVEALRGEDALEALDKARGEWEGLVNRADVTEPATVDVSDADLHARFEDACRRATERHANRQAMTQTRRAARSAVAGSRAHRVDRPARRKRRGNRSRPSGRRSSTRPTDLDPVDSAALRGRAEQASNSAPRSAGPPKNAQSASRCSASSS